MLIVAMMVVMMHLMYNPVPARDGAHPPACTNKGGGGGGKRRVEHMLLLMSLSTTRDAWLLLSAPAALSTCTRVREVNEWGLSEFSSGVSSGPLQQWGGFGMDLPLH